MFSRRVFLRNLGLALAGAALARCGPPSGGDAPRGRVRQAWLSLEELAETTRKKNERGEAMLAELKAGHQAALDELVTGGELPAAVAVDVQAAFGAAAYHAWRANAPITCYEPVIVDYRPTAAADMGQQAALLAEMAGEGDLDASTVARVQEALERDVAFAALSSEEVQALYTRLIEASEAGSAIPAFGEVSLTIPPEAVDAARFLIEVLGD